MYNPVGNNGWVLLVYSLIVLLLALVAGKRQLRGENEWLRNRLVTSGLMELLLGLSYQ